MGTLHTEALSGDALDAALSAFQAETGKGAKVLTAATINDGDLRNAAEILGAERGLAVRGSVNLPADTWRLE